MLYEQLSEAHFLLQLTKQAEQTIPQIAKNLESGHHIDLQNAYQWFIEIRPALLHTKTLHQVEEKLLQKILDKIDQLIRKKKYDEAQQMMALLTGQILAPQLSQQEIKELERRIQNGPQRLELTQSYLIAFLSGIIVGGFITYLYLMPALILK